MFLSSGMACLKRVDVPSAKIVPGVTQEADFFNPEQVCFNELGRASDFCRVMPFYQLLFLLITYISLLSSDSSIV